MKLPFLHPIPFSLVLQEEINEKRANSELAGNDVLSLMMSAKDEQGEGLSDIELKDQMMKNGGKNTFLSVFIFDLYTL